jgi:hypothetical protein
LAEIKNAMRQKPKPTTKAAEEKPTYKLQLPKRKRVSPRQMIRRLLRSMLPMGEEERQLKEEQSLFGKDKNNRHQ